VLAVLVAAASPADAQDSAKPASSSEVMARFGAHEGFNRLVLEWPGAIHANIATRDGVATLAFDRKAHLNLARLNDLLPPPMRPARLAADGSTLTFRIPAGVHLHDHSAGKLVIIDLVRGDAPDLAPSPAPPSPPPQVTPPPQVAVAPPAAPPTHTPPATHPPAAVKPSPKPKETAAATHSPPARPVQPPPVVEKPAASLSPVEDPPAAPPPQVAAIGPIPAAPPPQPLPLEGFEPVVIADTPDHRLRVTSVPLDGGVSLRFEWSESVKAAVFKLNRTAWVVFDHIDQVSLNPQVPAPAAVTGLTQIPSTAATILRFTVADDTRIIAGRAGNAWLVDARRAGPWEQTDTRPKGRALEAVDGLYATKKPGQPVTIVDPDSGEVLLAVPVRTAGVHFATNEGYQSFHMLPTAQGMLFRPESDRMRLLIEDDGARIMNLPPVVTLPGNQ
jgi:hypothetical protein